MADEVIHISDGESHCRVVHPSSGVIQVPLRQVSMSGALIDSTVAFEAEDAVDLTLVLKGLQPRQFFASVSERRPDGLQLQWVPIDGGEQARLKSLLEAYRTLNKPGPAPAPAPPPVQHERQSGRRVIKPRSSDSIVPFGEPAKPSVPSASPPSGPGPVPGMAQAEKPPTTRTASSTAIATPSSAVPVLPAATTPAPPPAPAAAVAPSASAPDPRRALLPRPRRRRRPRGPAPAPASATAPAAWSGRPRRTCRGWPRSRRSPMMAR